MKTIRIACEGASALPLEMFQELQGDLKILLREDYEKLKKEILEEGFSFTPHVWFDEDNNKYYLLDGHQRIRTLRTLVQEEGYECPHIPYSLTLADSYQQAKRKLLGAASQYGRMQEDGLLKYTQDLELTPKEMLEKYRFADLDLQKYMASNYESGDQMLNSLSQEKLDEQINLEQQYIVTALCKNENDMKSLFDELINRGFECKLIT